MPTGNFSTDPQTYVLNSLQKGYVGVRIEQGVPVLDRDLNLLGDLVAASLRQVIDKYMGAGVLLNSDGFAIAQLFNPTPDNDFLITAGSYLVGGLHVTTGYNMYSKQDGVPALTKPSGPRDDVVYLDVWLGELNDTSDPLLKNTQDVNVRTSLRVRPMWVVKVAENTTVLPSPPPGHVYSMLARLKRSSAQITASEITDTRIKQLNLADCIRRVKVIESALKPAFVTSPGQLTASGYTSWPKVIPGTQVTLNGINFNLGYNRVELSNGNIVVDVQATNPTPNQIVIIPPLGMPGASKVTVYTDFGSVTATESLYICGPPAFKTASPQYTLNNAPATTGKQLDITLFGSYFDTPISPTVKLVNTVSGALVSASVKTNSATAEYIGITVTVPTGSAGTYRFSLATSVGTAISTDTLVVS